MKEESEKIKKLYKAIRTVRNHGLFKRGESPIQLPEEDNGRTDKRRKEDNSKPSG